MKVFFVNKMEGFEKWDIKIDFRKLKYIEKRESMRCGNVERLRKKKKEEG